MPPFEIAMNETMLRVTVRGYWDKATAHLYAAELARRMQTSVCPPRWLIDLSDFAVQSREVADIISNVIGEAQRRFIQPRVALVEQRGLAALQSRRVAGQAIHFSFSTIGEAEAWLMSEGEPQAG